MHNNNHRLGIILAFAAIYIIWGTTYLAIAISIRTLPPFLSGGIRFLIAGGLMYAWLRLREPRPFANLNWRHVIICGVLMSGMGNGLVLWAQQGVPSGIAALLVGSLPICILAFDWMFFSRRAPTLQAVLGIAIALVGVVMIVLHTRSLAGARPVYVAANLLAVFAWSIGTLVQKKTARPEGVLNFTSLQMISGGLFQCFMAVVDREWLSFDASRISYSSVAAVLYLIVFGSIVAFSCYLWLLARVSAQKVTTYALVNPVIALLLGAVVLGERVTVLTVVSAVLVLLGVALVLFQSSAQLAKRRAELET